MTSQAQVLYVAPVRVDQLTLVSALALFASYAGQLEQLGEVVQ